MSNASDKTDRPDTAPEKATDTAEDPVLLNQMLVSPCVGVCVLNAVTGFCQGCWRSVEEISNWRTMPRDRRMEVLKRLAERRGAKSLTDRGLGPVKG